MQRQLRRAMAALMVLTLSVSACGNSGDDDDDTAEPAGGSDSGSGNEAPAGDRDEFVSLDGVPGVTDEAITYSVIATKANNPLGTCILDCYVDGIEAWLYPIVPSQVTG